MNSEVYIGKQIKFYRQEKQVKQEELAEYLGVSYQAVSKWETGASVPDIALLPKLAVYFGVSIDELFQIPYEEEMHWKNGSRWWNNSFTMQQSPRIYDGLCSMAQIHEMQKAYDKAVCDYKRIIKCLKEDYGVEHGEQVEQYEREIERLKNL